MNQKYFKVIAAVMGMVFAMAGCGPTPTPEITPTPTPEITAGPTPSPTTEPLSTRYFELTGEEYADAYVGLGSQYNHNLYADVSNSYGMNEGNYADLEGKVIALGSQHIRVFYDPDGNTTLDPGFESFYKVLQLCQNTPNATVNITYWHTAKITDMPVFAEVLRHIAEDLDLTCVTHVTIQNEPNSTNITKEQMAAMYIALDEELTELGVREHFKLIAGDLVLAGGSQSVWLTYFGPLLKDVVDGYSVHIYWNVWDIPYGMSRLTGTLADIASLPEDERKPIYITEFGVRGYRDKTTPGGAQYNATSFPDPGVDKSNDPNARPISESLINAFQHGRYDIEAVNAGIVATVKWDAYRAKYSTGNQDFSMIGLATDDYKLQPSYYQLRLMTAATTPGSTILKTIKKGSGAALMRMCALRSPTNEETFMFAHDFENTRDMVVNGLTPNKVYNIYMWNADGDGLISHETDISVDDMGRLVIPLKYNAIAVATTATLPFD